ncbi:hypothetical protein Tco_0993991 [Tanacetum coccineum]
MRDGRANFIKDDESLGGVKRARVRVALIIMVNKIPPDHVDDVPVIEPNQHDDVLVVLEPVLLDEDEDLEEDKIEEE